MKQPDPTDQRLLRVYATEAAIAAHEAFRSRVRALLRERVSGVPGEKKQALLEGLWALRAALSGHKERGQQG